MPSTGVRTALTTPCHYCGLAADTTDHVVPRVVIDQLRALGDDVLERTLRGRILTVRACRECNGLAGASLQPSLAERTAFVKRRLRRRYQSVIDTPDWTPEDLAGLRTPLRRYVMAAIAERERTARRIAW